jgi:hypothetical protein
VQKRGNFYGSGIVGAIQYFEEKYGRAASHDAIASLQPDHRAFVKPNTPLMGLLPTKLYPYAFIGDLIRNMCRAIKAPDEDAFIREITFAGMDATLSTIHRVILRWVATPQDHAKRAQQIWDQYHDAGRVTVLSATDHEYVVQLSDWPNHDVTVCKICLEARRRVLEKTGAKITEARREKCIAWGHDVCVSRYRW